MTNSALPHPPPASGPQSGALTSCRAARSLALRPPCMSAVATDLTWLDRARWCQTLAVGVECAAFTSTLAPGERRQSSQAANLATGLTTGAGIYERRSAALREDTQVAKLTGRRLLRASAHLVLLVFGIGHAGHRAGRPSSKRALPTALGFCDAHRSPPRRRRAVCWPSGASEPDHQRVATPPTGAPGTMGK